MKKFNVALCLLLAIVAFQVLQNSGNTSEPSVTIKPNALTPSAPLIIGSVSHIVDTYGFPGAGTANNPYIISGLSIESTTAYALIDIRSLQVHILITGNFLNASGLTYQGIYLRNASNVQIIDNEIYARETSTAADAAGVSIVENSNNNRVVGNQFQDTDYGVYIQTLSGSTSSPRNNTVLNNQFDNIFRIGVRVDSLIADLIISNNSIIGNTFTGANLGIQLNSRVTTSGISDHKIHDNTFLDCGTGIYLVAQGNDHLYPNLNRNISIINNTISRSLYEGIVLWRHSFNTIENNSIIDGQDNGIYLYSTSNNTIENNLIFKNEKNGIYLQYANNENNTIINNIIANNSINSFYYGIMFDANTKNNYVINNTIANNTSFGVYVNFNSLHDNYISGNDFIDNNGGGTQADSRKLDMSIF